MVCGLRDSLVDQGRDMKGSHLTFLHHFKVNSHSKCPYFLISYRYYMSGLSDLPLTQLKSVVDSIPAFYI